VLPFLIRFSLPAFILVLRLKLPPSLPVLYKRFSPPRRSVILFKLTSRKCLDAIKRSPFLFPFPPTTPSFQLLVDSFFIFFFPLAQCSPRDAVTFQSASDSLFTVRCPGILRVRWVPHRVQVAPLCSQIFRPSFFSGPLHPFFSGCAFCQSIYPPRLPFFHL